MIEFPYKDHRLSIGTLNYCVVDAILFVALYIYCLQIVSCLHDVALFKGMSSRLLL